MVVLLRRHHHHYHRLLIVHHLTAMEILHMMISQNGNEIGQQANGEPGDELREAEDIGRRRRVGEAE